MTFQKDVCVVCLEPISNPVCTECHLKEVASWMKDRGINFFVMNILLKKIQRTAITEDLVDNSKCILCGEEIITNCSYCFFLRAAYALLEMNFPNKFIKDFLETFNYSLGHSDYEVHFSQ